MWDGHLESQKNPDRLKRSIHVDRIGVHSTFVYTVSHFGEHKRLHLESSKQNYYIISLRAITNAIFTSLTLASFVGKKRQRIITTEGLITCLDPGRGWTITSGGWNFLNKQECWEGHEQALIQ